MVRVMNRVTRGTGPRHARVMVRVMNRVTRGTGPRHARVMVRVTGSPRKQCAVWSASPTLAPQRPSWMPTQRAAASTWRWPPWSR